ncbi:MAG: 4-hydroxy-3-methylbut-2-en-1-yl diphosphate synthase [Tannerellaceae bacterium]|nr:4-hydroxy-3-methylbut-2-en-1-yl diphosphate synthase [Tannerellaceae bacterium]
MDIFNYRRRQSLVVEIGNTPLGGENPIRVQTMSNVSTMDTDAAVRQSICMIEAGAEYIRFTAQGEREARNLGNIKNELQQRGHNTPIVADIHFNPKAADVAAEFVDKVRINPGNYVDRVKTFNHIEYTDEEYAAEIEKIRERFIPFLNICRKYHTAIRIGVNHGSLSDRIMSRYGDTPEGMVESCMEFLRICRSEEFKDVVISIKASNTVVMVKTVRLLVETMEKENMYYPLHLGVTEAGDGEDGRIKSAVGIGALLADGIGDTIRVSLSEDPEAEIPVARQLADYIHDREGHHPITGTTVSGYSHTRMQRYMNRSVKNIGGTHVPVVISDRREGDFEFDVQAKPDYLYIGEEDPDNLPDTFQLIVDANYWKPLPNVFPMFIASEVSEMHKYASAIKFIRLTHSDLKEHTLQTLKDDPAAVIILSTHNKNGLGAQRAALHKLLRNNCNVPVILHHDYKEKNEETLQIKSAADFGPLLLDGFGDGVMLYNEGGVAKIADSYSFGILQATRSRISKTEYISCPGCGRTLYDLQSTIARIKDATSHLKGLKIGIMGCIVNGPGEMADADYGYVGSGRGKVDLYKGKSCMLKNIPEEEAVVQLIQLIKENGDWQPR